MNFDILFFLQKKQLFADLNELSEEIQGVLMNHLSMFNIKTPSDITKIEERVRYTRGSRANKSHGGKGNPYPLPPK